MSSEPMPEPGHNEVAALARNLARNCGFAVFPCHGDKSSATPYGFKDATADAITALWRRYPGPLIGIATGEISGIDALDLDVKHDAARAWWLAHRVQMPPTRTFRTRSGGVHFYFRHAPDVRNSAGKIALGVDVRGSGGFVISWFAAGLPCLNHVPPVPWPEWLLQLIMSGDEDQPWTDYDGTEDPIIMPPPSQKDGKPSLGANGKDHDAESARPRQAGRLRILSVDDLMASPQRDYLVKGLLSPAEISLLVGAKNARKTFLALHVCYGVAQGWPRILDRRVKQTSVLYLIAEGEAGIGKRVKALV
jgi:hypothetical protein